MGKVRGLSLHLFKCVITQNIYIKKKEGKKLRLMFGAFCDAFVGEVGKLLFSRVGRTVWFCTKTFKRSLKILSE